MPSFNDVMHGIVNSIDDVAHNIANSSIYSNVVPTKETFAKELSNAIGSNAKAKVSFIQDEIDFEVNSQLSMFLRKSSMTQEQKDAIGDELAKALYGTDYSDEAFGKLADIMRKHEIDEAIVDKFTKMAPERVRESISSHQVLPDTLTPNLTEGLKHPGLYAKTYFNNPDPKIKKQRIAAVAGTYGAVAVGGRLLSGGTITEDNYGRRDIAGIPFL